MTAEDVRGFIGCGAMQLWLLWNGARVCGAPAIDRTFKTIDFLVALDITRLHPHAYQFFFR